MKKQIETHQTCINILEAIIFYQGLLHRTRVEIKSYANLGMMWYTKHLNHNADIYTRCIDRLQQRYQRQVEMLGS
jgi:hypothetical protein